MLTKVLATFQRPKVLLRLWVRSMTAKQTGARQKVPFQGNPSGLGELAERMNPDAP